MLRQHSCFAACETCNLHTVGQWRPSTAPPAYRLNHSLWSSLGLVGPPPSSSQHYGLCDDRADRLGKPRQLYEWHAEACDLPAFERKRACAVLRGRQVVVAGDVYVPGDTKLKIKAIQMQRIHAAFGLGGEEGGWTSGGARGG